MSISRAALGVGMSHENTQHVQRRPHKLVRHSHWDCQRTSDAVPFRTVVKKGCRSQLFIGPWSPVSCTEVKNRFLETVVPPPKPSLMFSSARGLNQHSGQAFRQRI